MARIPADSVRIADRRPIPWIFGAMLLALASLAARSSADEGSPPDPSTPPAPVAPAVPATPDASGMPSAPAMPDSPPRPVAPGDRLPPVPSTGKVFDAPEAAAKALFDAMEANDDATLRSIAGPGNDDIVENGSDPVVRAQRAELAQAAKANLSFEKQSDGRLTVVVGRMEYPLAIPLVAKDGGWRFDAAAGRDELLARRIGEHELEAIGVCLAYIDAQVEYASKDRDGDGVKEYAQKLSSTAGNNDGLYWESADGDDASPAGPGLTPFRDAQKPDSAAHPPFDGYYWRILTAQGSHAPGGAYSYVINGNMIAGFALLAVPAQHRNSGVVSFLVSNQGKVFEKDLGKDTLNVASAIDSFDPDPSWTEVDDATLRTAAATSPEDAPFAEKAGTPRPPDSATATDSTTGATVATPAVLPVPSSPAPAPSPTRPGTPCPGR